MAIETSLSKVNIFSTKELYDENSASLGEDEISFIPVDEVVSTGFILPFAGFSVPEGWLPCNGAEVSRSTYAKLFAAIGTTYGSGNGSTTFNLPNLNNGSFLEGSNTVGVVKQAGLPNITGYLNSNNWAGNTSAGSALYPSGSGSNSAPSGSGPCQINIDASRCSSVYGKSDTVQPKSVTVKFCIKY